MKFLCFVLVMLTALTTTAAGLGNLFDLTKKPAPTPQPTPQPPKPPQPVKK
jgi:hypothetical protein